MKLTIGLSPLILLPSFPWSPAMTHQTQDFGASLDQRRESAPAVDQAGDRTTLVILVVAIIIQVIATMISSEY